MEKWGGGCRSTHILKNQEDGLFGLLRNECKVGILNLEFLWSDIISRTHEFVTTRNHSFFHFMLQFYGYHETQLYILS